MAFSFSNTTGAARNNKGFTLIELLIVIAIIAVLSVLGMTAYSLGIHRAKVARALGDMNRIAKAAAELGLDTGFTMNDQPYENCVANVEGLVTDTSQTGLVTNTPAVYPSSWKGPYLPKVPLDPWGQQYIIDPDYRCDYFPDVCNGLSDTAVSVLHSGGPNKSTINEYDSDNIALILCNE